MMSGPPVVQMELGELVKRWASANASLPVAVVVSIVDDVLAAHTNDNFMTRPRPLSLGDILLDEYGQAHLLAPGSLSCGELAEILRSLLVGGFGDYGIPPAAHTLLAQLAADEFLGSYFDADGIRHRIRATLGAPASRGEVGACVLQAQTTAASRSEEHHWSFVDQATVQVNTETPFTSGIEEDINLESLAGTNASGLLEQANDIPPPVEEPTEDLPRLTDVNVNSSTEEQAYMDVVSDIPSAELASEDDYPGQTDEEAAQSLPPSNIPDVSELEAQSTSEEVVQPPPMPDPTDDLMSLRAQEVEAEDEAPLEVPELVADGADSDDICVTNYPEPDYYMDPDGDQESQPPSLLPKARGGVFTRPTFRQVTREKSQPDSPSQIPRVRLVPSRRRPLTLPVAPPARLRSTSTGPADSMISLPRKDSPALWVGLVCVSLVVGALIYSMMAT